MTDTGPPQRKGVYEHDEALDALFLELPDPGARERLIEAYLPVAQRLARRYQGSGEPYDDLVQVASIGLIKAIDRFDPARGVPFVGYATPTILGELRRHFRDKTWSVHVPRQLQENAVRVRDVIEMLTQEEGRSPTVPDVAKASGLSEDDVLEATEALDAHSATSLDAPIGESLTFEDTLSTYDDRLEVAEGWADLVPLIRKLSERDRRVLVLRFFDGLTQLEIAKITGVSQMHVSRILSGAIEKLRTFGQEPAAGG